MAEHDEAEQGRHVAGAEDVADQAAGERHGGQPEDSEAGAEQPDRELGLGRDQEQRDHDRARQIDAGEQVLLAVPPAQVAGQEPADDVEATDQAERGGADQGIELERVDVGRQVGGDEGDVETADEEAAGQELITPVTAGLADRVADAAEGGFPRARLGPAGQQRGQRHDQRGERGQHDQRAGPADLADGHLGERQQQELADRAAGGRDPQRQAAAALGEGARHRRKYHGKSASADPDADEHAGAQVQAELTAAQAHDQQAERVEDAAERQHPTGAVAIGEHAHDRCHETPEQVLDGDGEGETGHADAQIPGHGLEEQPAGLAHAHVEGEHHHGADQHHSGHRDKKTPGSLGHDGRFLRTSAAQITGFAARGHPQERVRSCTATFWIGSGLALPHLWPARRGGVLCRARVSPIGPGTENGASRGPNVAMQDLTPACDPSL